jgi:hypothetical protein
MKLFFFLFLLLSTSAFARLDLLVEEERVYRGFQLALESKNSLSLFKQTKAERKLAFDAMEDARLSPEVWVPFHELKQLEASERLRWLRLRAEFGERNLQEENAILAGFHKEMDRELALELIQAEPILVSKKGKALAQRAAQLLPQESAAMRGFAFSPLSADVARDLFLNKPAAIAAYEGGRFLSTPRLFMFCRNNRRHPCLYAMRDKNDNPVRVNGKLWTQPALALSWDDRPFNKRGGHTPQGVYHVEGVMPQANDQLSFGRFRRLILDFSPGSANEQEQKKLLPASVQQFQWWREAVIARDMGRNLLRIHGTGKKNEDPTTPYYPFIPTAGCVAQREGAYDGEVFIDQRKILDAWMAASAMELKYENEAAIRGLFYVINVDEVEAPVTAEDLARYGIR